MSNNLPFRGQPFSSIALRVFGWKLGAIDSVGIDYEPTKAIIFESSFDVPNAYSRNIHVIYYFF